MFTKKNNSNTPENPKSTANSWINGKVGSLIIGSAIGYSLYKFGIINKIKNYLTNLTKKNTPINPTNPDTQTQG